ncbi:hypothetical protein GBAR_LOCUS30528 [Geodia barretti]|nr:hypothetical protein GBAR_LOCUS30528 [Geodia barretti]
MDRRSRTYYVNQTVQFNTMQDLISYYSKNNLNEATGTRLVTPVGGQPPTQNGSDDCYVVMEKHDTQGPPASLPQSKSTGRKFRNRPLPSAPGPALVQPTPVPAPVPKKPRPSGKNHTPTHKSHAPQSQEVPGLHRNLIKPLLKMAMQPYIAQDGWFLLRPSSTDNQLTLTVSHGGKILNFKLSEKGGQYSIAQKNKFPTVHALIVHYYSNPIRSKQRADQTILLMNPIPVDPQLEATAKEMAAQSEVQQQPQVGVASPGALPHPWQQFYNDQYQRNFYYNPETGASTWEVPMAPPTTPKPHPQPQIAEQTKRIQQRPLPSLPGHEEVEPEPANPSPSVIKKRQTMPSGSARPQSVKKKGVPLPSLLEKTTEQSMANGFHPLQGGDRPPAVLPGQVESPHNTASSEGPPTLPPTNRSRRHASVCAATRGRPPLPTPADEYNQHPSVLRSRRSASYLRYP